MAGNFAFSAETFPDSPFLRTELLELEADCVVVQRQSAKISKGLTAYLAAIDAFRDAGATFTEVLKSVASDGTGTTTEHGTAATASLRQLGKWLTNHTESLADLKVCLLGRQVASLLNEKLTPLSQGTHQKEYREAASAVVISTAAYESARRADAGMRRKAARIVLEEARFAQLSTALRVDRESHLQLSDLLLDLTMAHNLQALRMLEVTHEGALALGEIREANLRSRSRLQQEQSELAEAFSSYCRFLEGRGGEGKRHIAALGPDTSSRRYKEIASLMLLTAASGGNPVAIKQGYLWKKYTTLGMDSWKKRFCVIDSKGDFYYLSNSDRPLARSSTVAVSEPILRVNSRGADADDASGQPAIGGRSVNLLTAGLRPGVEDPAVAFGLTVMAIDSSYHLQAESDAERDDWIEVASIVTSELLNDSSADSRGGTPSRQAAFISQRSEGGMDSAPSECEPPSVLEALWALGGFGTCADCGAQQPDWASLNLGVLFCLQCSGVHRQLGVTVSKVRSCVLDVRSWTPAAIELFRCMGGNAKANSVWEARLAGGGGGAAAKPEADASLDAKATFIRAKYGARAFIDPPPAGQTAVSAARALEEAVHAGDAMAALRILLSPINSPSGPWVSFAGAVLCTAASEPEHLGMLELLLHYLPRACIQAHDEMGLTSLHHAARTGNADGVAALLLRGADAAERDKSGRTALQFIQPPGGAPASSSASLGDASLPRTPSSSAAKSSSVVDIVGMLAAAEATSRDASEGLLSP